jgi:hypothetical protein
MRRLLVALRILFALLSMALFAGLFVYALGLAWQQLAAGRLAWALLHVAGAFCWLILVRAARCLVLPP